jgi:hypothetical protein
MVLLMIFLNLLNILQALQKINAYKGSYPADEVMIIFLVTHRYGFILKQRHVSLIHQMP